MIDTMRVFFPHARREYVPPNWKVTGFGFRLGQIGGTGKIAAMTPQTFRHKIIVKGDPNILDYIASNLNLNQPGQVVKHSDPSDVKVTDEQMQLMRGGMPIQFGTTRLEISFNSNIDQLKAIILENYPNLTVE